MSDTPAERVQALVDHCRPLTPKGGYLFKISTYGEDGQPGSVHELRMDDLDTLLFHSRCWQEHRSALEALGWARPPF